jgi:arylsulfatase A-like enzyme
VLFRSTLGRIFADAGYATGYIGKWHLNGHPPGVAYPESRNAPVPRERRQGFEFWKVRECTHEYNQSYYFDEQDRKCYWEGYDAIAQTRMAQQYIRDRRQDEDRPFLLVLSWGPPHDPYHTAPEEVRSLYPDPEKILLRPNVPAASRPLAQKTLAGYYAHIAALDQCFGELCKTMNESGMEDNTVLVFTSDHGDMLYSQGETMKQKPWDESIRVPFLLRCPAKLGNRRRPCDTPINTPDILPTLLGLCGLPIPGSVEGKDYSPLLRGGREPEHQAALLSCLVPFHQWNYRNGGREYRGLRSTRYTYVRDLRGPWLLYDNHRDPFQLTNLCERREYASLQKEMEHLLQVRLRQAGDRFLPGPEYMRQWAYTWDGQDAPN